MKKQWQRKGKHEAPRQRRVPGRDRESVCRRNGVKMDLILLSLLFFAVGVLHLSGTGILDARNQEIARLERQRQSLVTENERIRLVISQVDTLESVEYRARQELGMVRAGADDRWVVALAPPGADGSWGDATHAAETSEGPRGAEDAQAPGHSLLQAAQDSLQGILKRWNF